MPLLDSAARSYGSEVVILGVASKDDPAEAQRFLDDLGVTYPNVFDESGQVRVALGLTAYPTTYVFGGDGRLRARVDGGISEQRLAGLVEDRSEEHTSELQSLMRLSYAVFCLQKKNQ